MASAAHTPASSGTTAALGDVKIAFSEEGDYLAILYSLGESIVKVYSADDGKLGGEALETGRVVTK